MTIASESKFTVDFILLGYLDADGRIGGYSLIQKGNTSYLRSCLENPNARKLGTIAASISFLGDDYEYFKNYAYRTRDNIAKFRAYKSKVRNVMKKIQETLTLPLDEYDESLDELIQLIEKLK